MSYSTFFLIAGLVFFVDQITKYWIASILVPGQSWPLISGIFHLTYVRNPGAAFGIFPYQTYFFIILSAIMVVALIAAGRYFAPRYFFVRLSLACLLGGVSGNMIDRLRTGYVIDFIDLRFWPVFNLADAAIVIGILSLFIGIYLMQEKLF